jgi:hypothetical protein
MPRIVLEIDGWKKVVDLSLAVLQTGCVEYDFYPKVPFVHHEESPANKLTITTVKFYLEGKRGGLPLFKARL